MPRNVIVIGHEIWLRLFAEKFVLKVKLCGVDKIQYSNLTPNANIPYGQLSAKLPHRWSYVRANFVFGTVDPLVYCHEKNKENTNNLSCNSNLSVQTGVGFSPLRSVNLPFCHLGLAKGRFSSL